MAGKIKKPRGAKSVTETPESPVIAEAVDPRQLTNEQKEWLERFVHRFGEDAALGLGDYGNWAYKQQLAGRPEKRTLMLNRIARINESQWEHYRQRALYSSERFSNTVLFGLKERKTPGNTERKTSYVAVGDFAENYATPITMTDDIKYDYNAYWGIVIASNLYRMFPNGHSNIVLAVAHPMKSVGQRELMMKLTLGHHTIETIDGKTVKFTVTEVLPWDEPMGGAVAWASGSTGDDLVYNKYDLKPGDMVMCHDIGGGISSMNRLQVDYDPNGRLIFVPVYNQRLSPTIEYGLRDVQLALRDILLQDRKEFLGMGPNLTINMVNEGIATGSISISGKPVPVHEERDAAESVLLSPTIAAYNGPMGGGRPFKAIITTGGGMHIYHNRFIKELYNHGTVDPCVSLMNIQWANPVGGDVIFEQWVNRELGYGN